MLHEIQVEGTFEDGYACFWPLIPGDLLISPRVFLVTVHDPICSDSGNLNAALHGSFLPIPSDDLFPSTDNSLISPGNIPGAVVAKQESIVINKGRERVKLRVTNNGDRPIQVGHLGLQVAYHTAYFGPFRSVHTTTLLRRILLCHLTGQKPMESVSI